mmetsp:Transcript_11139/g.22787  ORF Transcript_11139/g.22787 Transcript_11139/m.22787 type:complete len:108 (+) Transcript_11139:1751-2074(+)
MRREYDRDLKSGRAGRTSAGGGERHGSWSTSYREKYRHRTRDPFAQFDDLFRNDPFFREAFDGMDDLFTKTFQSGGVKVMLTDMDQILLLPRNIATGLWDGVDGQVG